MSGLPGGVYEGARTEELSEPLLPRWFVLLALATVPVALGVAVWAFLAFGPEEVPVAERRPPPAGDLTTDVGQYDVGDSDPVPLTFESCQLFRGIRAGGSEPDRERIRTALATLCEQNLPEDVARRIRLFAQQQGVVRFAQFQATGVDSTLDTSTDPPRILLNARFAGADTDPVWIAPLVVHDTTYLEREPGTAAAALEARQAEATTCARLFTEDRPSRACEDAQAVVDLPDPLRALEAAGFS